MIFCNPSFFYECYIISSILVSLKKIIIPHGIFNIPCGMLHGKISHGMFIIPHGMLIIPHGIIYKGLKIMNIPWRIINISCGMINIPCEILPNHFFQCRIKFLSLKRYRTDIYLIMKTIF